MPDQYGQVRPDDPTYLYDIERIRTRLVPGPFSHPLYLEYADLMTGMKFLVIPGHSIEHFAEPWGTKKYNTNTVAFYYEDHRGPLFARLDGPDWVHWTYVAEKFGIEQYRTQAVSVANFINRILGWGDDKMQTEEDA
jgi:hypothetical protein